MSSGNNCTEIVAAYADALKEAQLCDTSARDICGAERPEKPQDPCKCQVAVRTDGTAELDKLLVRFKDAACSADQPVCNHGACVLPEHTCRAEEGTGPTCH